MMNRACAFIVCPRCGYRILLPHKSALIEFLKRIAKVMGWRKSTTNS